MTPEQVALVQASFMQFAPEAEVVAARFYDRLFALDPALRPLFTGDMHAQGGKLLTMLVIVVRGLTRIDLLLPSIHALGRRHADYGVAHAHYDTVGAALLWALEQQLGERWTTEVAGAWTEAYTLLAREMRAAAPELAMTTS